MGDPAIGPHATPSEAGPAPSYPAGWVLGLLGTAAVTEPTRRALRARLDETPAQSPRFFDGPAFADLEAVCARLVPQPDRPHPIRLAAAVDARLAEGRGDGWRYDDMPDDREAYRRGLRGLSESALILFGASFGELDPSAQDRLLTLVQSGDVPGETWQAVRAARFFEELLAEVVEAYYAHPLAQEEIGYAGMADVPGWDRVGLDEREAREPPAEPA